MQADQIISRFAELLENDQQYSAEANQLIAQYAAIKHLDETMADVELHGLAEELLDQE